VWHKHCSIISVFFHNDRGDGAAKGQQSSAFTMVEVIVAIALIGIGVSTTIAALTKFNEFASTSRNATGAYTLAMNQIDAIQAATPVDPTNVFPATSVPQSLAALVTVIAWGQGAPPIVGTATLPDTRTVSGTISNVPVYKEDDPTITTNAVVFATVTTTITDVSPTPSVAPFLYNATITVTYTYLNRNYSFSMSTLRTAD
jgi:prepilin-type N-terminal cleavage/methylation domain-containing protein